VVTNLNAERLDGHYAGNFTGQVPLNNTARCVDLNADMLDGYHAGNSSGEIPISNGSTNDNLGADRLDGYHYTDFATAGHNHWGQTWTGTGTGLTLSGGGTGLSGSGSDRGVYGVGNGLNGVGVSGESGWASGKGVSGLASHGSGTNYGVWGESSSTAGTGVHGSATASSGTTYGVFGGSLSSQGYGGYFVSSSQVEGMAKAGVFGQDFSNTGVGVAGEGYHGGVGVGAWSGSGDMIRAYAGNYPNGTLRFRVDSSGEVWAGTAGDSRVWHAGNDGAGSTLNADLLDGYHAGNSSGNVPISNGSTNTNLSADLLDGYHNGAVSADLLDGSHATAFATASHNHWGQTWTGSGTGLTLSGGTTGLSGSGSTEGVYGASSSTSGKGVYGYASATSGENCGVNGVSESSAGYGGYFVSQSNTSTATKAGVYGRDDSAAGFGVAGHNYYSGVGVGAWSFSGNLIEAYAGDYPDKSTRRFYVDALGNVYADGTYNSFKQTGGSDGAEHRTLYGMTSAEAWAEDFGSAALEGGKATVTIDPVFAQTVNLAVEYHVYLTPLCQEAVLLFVTAKSPASFAVQGVTLDGEPSQCSFDYRIVAKQLGYEDLRLEQVEIPPPVEVEKEKEP